MHKPAAENSVTNSKQPYLFKENGKEQHKVLMTVKHLDILPFCLAER